MKRFVYVFSIAHRDALMAKGLELMYSDPKQDLYIFLNEDPDMLTDLEFDYTTSDTMIF